MYPCSDGVIAVTIFGYKVPTDIQVGLMMLKEGLA